MNEFIVSVDIAKKRDFFGIMVLRDVPRLVPAQEVLGGPDRVLHRYDITRIEKYQGMEYTEMAGRLALLMNHTDLRNNTDLLVDGTGVGEAAVELIRREGLNPVPVIFTAAGAVRERYAGFGEVFGGPGGGGPPGWPGALRGARVLKEIHVPKKDLVAAGSILLQQRRVAAAPGRWAEEFRKQLEAFRGKVNEATRRVAYEAERESDHDDLVVCYLMGAWWILNRRERGAIEERRLACEEQAAYDPLNFV
jgi:hypothetical protein